MQRSVVGAWFAVAITPVALFGQVSRTTRCDSIQYRFVDEAAPMSARRYPSIQDAESYALRDSIVVDGRGIADIQVWGHRVGTDSTWDVIARLTPAGTSAMASATGRNLGQTLVALLGDTITEHGIIESPLASRVPVRLGVTRAEADSVADRARRVSGTSCTIP
jgi:preprotein translocase subunit SecD